MVKKSSYNLSLAVQINIKLNWLPVKVFKASADLGGEVGADKLYIYMSTLAKTNLQWF